MAVSYKKLWHILVDRDMKKIELEKKAGMICRLTQWHVDKEWQIVEPNNS